MHDNLKYFKYFGKLKLIIVGSENIINIKFKVIFVNEDNEWIKNGNHSYTIFI